MIFSIPKDGLLDRLQAIFRLRCTVMVRIRVKVSSSVNGVRVKVRVSVNMVTVRDGDGKCRPSCIFVHPGRKITPSIDQFGFLKQL